MWNWASACNVDSIWIECSFQEQRFASRAVTLPICRMHDGMFMQNYTNFCARHPLAAAFLWVSSSLTFPTIMAIQTLTFGEYVVDGLNPLLPIYPEYEELLKRLIGYLAIWLICFMNLFSLASSFQLTKLHKISFKKNKFAARFQVILTVIKLLVIALVIFTGLYQIFYKGHTEAFQEPFKGTNAEPGDFVLGLYASLLAYNGAYGLFYGKVLKCRLGHSKFCHWGNREPTTSVANCCTLWHCHLCRSLPADEHCLLCCHHAGGVSSNQCSGCCKIGFRKSFKFARNSPRKRWATSLVPYHSWLPSCCWATWTAPFLHHPGPFWPFIFDFPNLIDMYLLVPNGA